MQHLEASPTIAERVALGLDANRAEGGAIVPFPAGWKEDMFDAMLTGSAQHRLKSLRDEGWVISRLFFYHDDTGRRIAAAMRLDHGQSGKMVLPVRAFRALGLNPNIEIKGIEAPRPLYNLHHLAARPEAPVLMVEGEKAADAGTRLFADYVTTTWLGGAQGVTSADLRPLAGRYVTIWPDNDESGFSAADKLGSLLGKAGAASVRVVCPPPFLPKKWDIADRFPDKSHV